MLVTVNESEDEWTKAGSASLQEYKETELKVPDAVSWMETAGAERIRFRNEVVVIDNIPVKAVTRVQCNEVVAEL